MDRSLPSDVEAERATLGAILLNREAIVALDGWLMPEHFYLEKHAWIYEAMQACYRKRVPPDTSTVVAELRRRDRLEQVGGLLYLIDLANSVPTAVHIEYYAQTVERTATLRRLITAGGKIAALGFDERDDLEATLEKAEAELSSVSQRRANQDFVHIGQVVDAYFEQINYLKENRGEIVGIPTGYLDLDEVTGGLQRSDLIILAARPATGKTSLALCLAYNVAMLGNGTVGIFSLEMSRDQLVQRILAMHTGIDTQRLRTGNVRDTDLQRLMEALGQLSGVPLYIEDTAGLSISDVRAKARRLHAEAGLDLLIIDYLQLMQGRRSDNRVQEVSEISRGLKQLARELNVPLVALSQLSRAVEGRASHVPMLSDLRESGCLVGDSLVYLPDTGTYEPIDHLVGKSDFNVLALNTETWQLEPRRVLKAFSTGRKPVFRMKTRLGRSIRATANHKFLTIHGWKRLDELQISERVALPRQLPGSVDATMSGEELALLGHLIGDGCTLARQPIHYTTNDYDLAVLVADLAVQVFGERITPRIQLERTWYQVYLTASERLTHGKRNPIAAWLAAMNVFDLRSYEKFVPTCVFAQSETLIARFLRHLWATDGCIHLGGTVKHYPTIYYATSSARLAQDVQSLLLRMGMNAIVGISPQPGKGRHQYHVDVSGAQDQQRFIALIGAVGERKNASLASVEGYFQSRVANTNRDIIPRDVWRSVAVPAMQEIGLTTRQMQASLGNAYCGTGLYKQNLSRERASRLAQIVQSHTLEHLAHSDVYWDKIIEVVADGEEDVYDLTVEDLHNFVADNIIVHNSIEQDADIVMFIYREELYDKETDKKGIAEIHIAKHRNGPTAVVPLRFDANTTSFQSLERYRSPEGY